MLFFGFIISAISEALEVGRPRRKTQASQLVHQLKVVLKPCAQAMQACALMGYSPCKPCLQSASASAQRGKLFRGKMESVSRSQLAVDNPVCVRPAGHLQPTVVPL